MTSLGRLVAAKNHSITIAAPLCVLFAKWPDYQYLTLHCQMINLEEDTHALSERYTADIGSVKTNHITGRVLIKK